MTTRDLWHSTEPQQPESDEDESCLECGGGPALAEYGGTCSPYCRRQAELDYIADQRMDQMRDDAAE